MDYVIVNPTRPMGIGGTQVPVAGDDPCTYPSWRKAREAQVLVEQDANGKFEDYLMIRALVDPGLIEQAIVALEELGETEISHCLRESSGYAQSPIEYPDYAAITREILEEYAEIN